MVFDTADEINSIRPPPHHWKEWINYYFNTTETIPTMSSTDFLLDQLVESAEPHDNIAFGGPEADKSPVTLRCAICGVPASETNLPAGYANPVCKACDELAVNEDKEAPWHGWPPGDEPDTEQGVVVSPPDVGENPVYIAGAKCWRRYRFGGWITRRDAFDCGSLEEFRERHRTDDGIVIYAFNTAQPDGVAIPRDQCQVAVTRQATIESLLEEAEKIARGEQTATTLAELSDRVAAAGLSVPDRVPDPDAADRTEYAESVLIAAERELEEGAAFADLCRRYYEDFTETGPSK